MPIGGLSEINTLSKNLSLDGDGFIRYNDFLSDCYMSYLYLKEDNLKKKLRVLDKSNSGKVTIK